MRYKRLLIWLMIVLAVGAVVWHYFPQGWRDTMTMEFKLAQLRDQLAFESLEERVPKGKGIPLSKPLTAEADARWQKFDGDVGDASAWRTGALKALHDGTLKLFVESPGQGSFRRVGSHLGNVPFNSDARPYEWEIAREVWLPNPQLGQRADFAVASADGSNLLKPANDDYGNHFHEILDFLNPSGFGYFLDRRRVSGFESHRFSYRDPRAGPKPPWKVAEARWNLDQILLVGILLHDEPLVYLTDHLPSMEQVRTGKTRKLDWFEQDGLNALAGGEDLYLRTKENELRMLGALRATKQCLKCHDGNIGDLLGAFSYTMRKPTISTQP